MRLRRKRCPWCCKGYVSSDRVVKEENTKLVSTPQKHVGRHGKGATAGKSAARSKSKFSKKRKDNTESKRTRTKTLRHMSLCPKTATRTPLLLSILTGGEVFFCIILASIRCRVENKREKDNLPLSIGNANCLYCFSVEHIPRNVQIRMRI